MSAPSGRPILIVATAAVVVSVIAGIIVIGSPSEGRFQQLDSGRVADLRGIMQATDLFWARNERLPGSLAELAADPRTSVNMVDPASGEPYAYRAIDDATYEVCATFDRASPDTPGRSSDDFWRHEAGRQCFEIGADKTVRREAFGIALVDLAGESSRQTVVDRDPNQYLGHPTTHLLDDGTLLVVYPEGHGQGPIIYKRSDDGGLTWSQRLPVPESWATSQEVPTLYGFTTPEGHPRLIVFSGLYPIRRAISDDRGQSWSELEPIGDFGGIVAMASLHQQQTGDLLGFFHDDGRFLRDSGEAAAFQVFATRSSDGGLSWTEPWVIAEHPDADLCEPGLVASPDGRRLALLLRENSRKHPSFIVFSDDDGVSWSEPRELPATLTGDRHTARYAPDGRLLVTFRDMAAESPTKGDWVLWVGSWDDLETGAPGAFRVRLMDNTDAWDAAYPGLELLEDGTFVATTYGHWREGEPPYVVSVRFRMDELDARRPGRLSARSSRSVRRVPSG